MDQVVTDDAGVDASFEDAASAPELDAALERRDASVVKDAGLDASAPRDAGDAHDASVDAGGLDAARGDAATGVPDASTANDAGADAGSRCIPGRYVGAFAGEISALLGLIRLDITGTISLEIAATANGDQLQIKNGKLMGTDQDGNPLTALVSGTLNCATLKLENGRITEGAYNRVDPIFGGPPSTTNFSGTATATYNPTQNPPSAQGKWEVKNSDESRGGSGSWTATLQR